MANRLKGRDAKERVFVCSSRVGRALDDDEMADQFKIAALLE
jgi:hypothetical protein